MNFDEMAQAVREAKNTLALTDRFVEQMASMIVGRLRKANVSSYYLRALKKELQHYNMHTGVWNDD